MEWLIGTGLFVAAACIVGGVLFLLRPKWDPESRTVEKRLGKFATPVPGEKTVDITRRRPLSDIPKLNEMLSGIPVMHQIDKLVVQANVRWPLGVFLLLCPTIALTAYLLFSLLTRSHAMGIFTGIIAGTAPFGYLYFKKRQRVRKFERQLPDALDLMARSLRAGHAFSGGLAMVAEEFDDPAGTEFLRVINEINFGASLDQALKNLTDRVDLPDLRFFTVSVIIQRETGGNLAEILESIARLIRERFKLLGKIRALSAEGRLSGIILVGLPFLVAFALSIVSPTYLPALFNDPAGRTIVIVALFMMGLGVLIIRRIVNIRV
jgi:tight adherence protein B